MKAKHVVTFCCVIGLAMAVMGFVGTALAESQVSSSSSAGIGPAPEGLAGGVEVEDAAPAASLPLAYLRVSGSVFRPRDSGTGWASNGGWVYATSGSSTEIFNTPVYLPQGAVVDHIRMYFYDNSSSNCYGWFTVYNLNGEIVDEWFALSSGTPGNDHSDSPAINHTVNYGTYSYVLNWRPNQLGSTMMLNGFRIYYYPSGTRYGEALILSSPPP